METGPPHDASYARLRHLQSISEAALANLDFAELVDELLRRLTEILNVDTAAVLLLSEDGDELVARAARGIEAEVAAGSRIPLGRGFAGRIAAERRPVIIPDVSQADVYNPILRERGLISLLGVPLIVEGRLTGVVHVGTLTPRDFTEDDSELLQLAADRIALAIDHARLYEAERDAAGALRRLEAITELALAHLTLDDLLEVLLVRIRDLISTDTVVVELIDAEREELVSRATLGVDPKMLTGVPVPLGEGFSGRVAAEGRAMAIEDVPDSDIVTSALREARVRSLLGVPLVVGGTVIGVLGVGTFEARRFRREDIELVQRAGDRIALAIENARLYEAERTARAAAEAAADRIRRIEAITEVALHHIALDDEILESLLSRVRAVLDVDTAALYVTNESTQVLVARAAKGLEEDVERGVEIPIGRGFAGTVAERRETVAMADIGDFALISPLLREKGIRSLLGVPLVVEERLLGVLHVGTFERREFDSGDRALLELAGERLAVALDHSRLFEREHLVATTLQRTLLPARLPDLPGAEVAVRYLPGEGEAVGGDWYDVVQLRDRRVALALGDVVSHGLRAASVMGQLRNAVRAYAVESYEPATVLARLDVLTRELEGREMATLAYAVFDPETCTLTYASAGHPPPQYVTPDGRVTLLEEGRGPPLGAVPDAIYQDATAELAPGATLLLYSDGIVERRDMWIDEGLARLSGALEGLAGMEPEPLLDRLMDSLLPAEGVTDDVALLALRIEPAAAGPLRVRLPADPTILASLRHSLRQWLGEAGANEDEIYDILVATTEAAANAVEHAYGPADASFEVEARAALDREVSIVVRDRGAWRPPRGRNRGRGTLLMQELTDELEVSTGETGTEVRLVKRLAKALVA